MDGVLSVILTNTKQYPFNNSTESVSLDCEQENSQYYVQTEVISAEGQAGEVRVFDKAVNGFRIAFTGSAASVEVRCKIIPEKR